MVKIDPNRFRSSFYSFGRASFDPVLWASYFTSYDIKLWNEERDGSISYVDDDFRTYSLAITHLPNGGFVIHHSCSDQISVRSLWGRLAVENEQGLNEFEEVDDDLFPKGCILSPTTAGLVVEDFLKNPMEPSVRVKMIDENNIQWPDCLN